MANKKKLKAKKLGKVKPLTLGIGDGPVHGPIITPIPRLAANHNEVVLRG